MIQPEERPPWPEHATAEPQGRTRTDPPAPQSASRRHSPTELIARRAGTGVVSLGLRYALGFALNMAGLLAATNALGGASFGVLFVLPLMFINICQILSSGVWATLIQQPVTSSRALRDTGFVLQMALGIACALLIGAIAGPLFAAHFAEPALLQLCIAAGIGGALTCVRWFATGLAERRLGYRTISVAELLDLFVFNAVVVTGCLRGEPLLAIGLALATRGAPSLVFLWFRLRPRVRLRLNRRALGIYSGFGLPYLGFSILQAGPVHLIPAAAAFLLAPAQGALMLSVLGLCYRILELPRVLVTIAQRVGLSAHSRLADDPEAFHRSVHLGFNALAALVTPAIAALALLGPFYIEPVFGSGFREATPLLLLLAPAFILNAGWTYLATTISAQGAAKFAFGYYGIYNIVLWSLVFILTRSAPFLGVPIAETVAALLGFALLGRIGRIPGSSLGVRHILEPVAITAGILAVAHFSYGGMLQIAWGVAPLALLVYFGLRYRKTVVQLLRILRSGVSAQGAIPGPTP